jgi:hypothetical protein
VNAREQIATIIELWRAPKQGVVYASDYEDLIDTMLHLFHRNGITLSPKGRSPMTDKLERVVELTAERKSLAVRLEAIDDELSDLMQGGELDLGNGMKIVREGVKRTPNANGSRKRLNREIVEGFVASFRTQHNNYPTVREIAQHFECSGSSAAYHLQQIKIGFDKTAS